MYLENVPIREGIISYDLKYLLHPSVSVLSTEPKVYPANF